MFFLALKKETLTPYGVRQQIVSWSDSRLGLLIFILREGHRISRWIILILARVHSKALTLAPTGHFELVFVFFGQTSSLLLS